MVRWLVHATRYEPVTVDAAEGMMAFDVPYRRVETGLIGFSNNLPTQSPIQRQTTGPHLA
jgi:hypothetical protein